MRSLYRNMQILCKLLDKSQNSRNASQVSKISLIDTTLFVGGKITIIRIIHIHISFIMAYRSLTCFSNMMCLSCIYQCVHYQRMECISLPSGIIHQSQFCCWCAGSYPPTLGSPIEGRSAETSSHYTPS